MPRQPRKLSSADIYHVAIRGVGRVLIFEDDSDRNRFLELLAGMLHATNGKLLAWCLMGNHVHLLFQLDLETLSKGMKQLESAYASYFNKRHSRAGHLFQDRFSSEPVNDNSYLLTVVRYIHANPEKAGLARIADYPWSSYREYLGKQRLCNTDLVLAMVGGRNGFEKLHASEGSSLTALSEGYRLSNANEDEIRRVVASTIGEDVLRTLHSMNRSERDPIVSEMLRAGLSVRQIERLTGIGRGIVQRIRQRGA